MTNPIGIHLSFWTNQWSDSVLPLLERARDAGAGVEGRRRETPKDGHRQRVDG